MKNMTQKQRDKAHNLLNKIISSTPKVPVTIIRIDTMVSRLQAEKYKKAKVEKIIDIISGDGERNKTLCEKIGAYQTQPFHWLKEDQHIPKKYCQPLVDYAKELGIEITLNNLRPDEFEVGE